MTLPPSPAPDLSTLVEEDEDLTRADVERHLATGTIQIVDVRDGVPHPVDYSELATRDKQNVLADLLVKSAINQALDKQRQVSERAHHFF